MSTYSMLYYGSLWFNDVQSVPSPCFLQASPAKLPLCRFNEGTTTFQARANRVRRHRKQKHQKDLLLFVFSFCDSSSPFSTGRSVVLNMAFGSSAEHEQLSMEKMPLNFQSMSMSTNLNWLRKKRLEERRGGSEDFPGTGGSWLIFASPGNIWVNGWHWICLPQGKTKRGAPSKTQRRGP